MSDINTKCNCPHCQASLQVAISSDTFSEIGPNEHVEMGIKCGACKRQFYMYAQVELYITRHKATGANPVAKKLRLGS